MRKLGNYECQYAEKADRVTIDFDRMYRGMGPPLIGVTPIFAISFWVSLVFSRHSSRGTSS